ncbi:phosphoribosyltransferase [Candidatus Dependentiae bacterium]|nr:phosphoribosyltransferase [Candidatus Dependentiae bacterium]
MKFKDRADAGQQLALLLSAYKHSPNVLVVGLVRGGVPVAAEIARELVVPLDIVVVRKIGAPGMPELAVGALTQTGQSILNYAMMQTMGITEQQIAPIIRQEQKELARRLSVYREDKKSPNYADKTVILVDDGIATGATMQAAIASVKELGAKRLVLAVPVCPAEVAQKLSELVDEFICLEQQPDYFPAVGYFYEHFEQVEDETVKSLMASIFSGAKK